MHNCWLLASTAIFQLLNTKTSISDRFNAFRYILASTFKLEMLDAIQNHLLKSVCDLQGCVVDKTGRVAPIIVPNLNRGQQPIKPVHPLQVVHNVGVWLHVSQKQAPP